MARWLSPLSHATPCRARVGGWVAADARPGGAHRQGEERGDRTGTPTREKRNERGEGRGVGLCRRGRLPSHPPPARPPQKNAPRSKVWKGLPPARPPPHPHQRAHWREKSLQAHQWTRCSQQARPKACRPPPPSLSSHTPRRTRNSGAPPPEEGAERRHHRCPTQPPPQRAARHPVATGSRSRPPFGFPLVWRSPPPPGCRAVSPPGPPTTSALLGCKIHDGTT